VLDQLPRSGLGWFSFHVEISIILLLRSRNFLWANQTRIKHARARRSVKIYNLHELFLRSSATIRSAPRFIGFKQIPPLPPPR
jgi:hypothetical protein